MTRRTFVSTAAVTGAAVLAGLTSRSIRTAHDAGHPARYAFSDEFDGPAGSAPNPAHWGYAIGQNKTDELQVYTSSRENSFLDGQGHLVIRATKTVRASGGRAITTYRSAMLRTRGKFSKYHGTFEARIKLDIQPGLWPAWWGCGANLPEVGWPACGEVDMLENYGRRPLVRTSVHTPNNAGTNVLTRDADIGVDDQWHTWRMRWSRDGFRFHKDGVPYLTVKPGQLANWCFSSGVPLNMVLSLAVGGGVGPPPATVRFPVDLMVDYVRVW